MPDQPDPFSGGPCLQQAMLDPCAPDCREKGCEEKGDAFFEKTLEDFQFPLSGSDVKIFICSPEHWSPCMWVVGCAPDGSNFYLKIISISKRDGYLIAYNGCPTSAIDTNPTAGTKIPKGTTIFPGVFNCRNASGCENVADCLKSLETICFENVPETDNTTENYHLFAGEGDQTKTPEFWQSCLHKIKNVYLGMFGRTFCFKNIPSSSAESSNVGGVIYPKHIAYIDSLNGCLVKGDTVNGSLGCNVPALTDEGIFSTITVCGDDGLRYKLEPECGKEIYVDKDGEDVVWKYGTPPYPKYLATQPALTGGTGGMLTTVPTQDWEFDLADKDIPCWARFAEVETFIQVNNAHGTNPTISLFAYLTATLKTRFSYVYSSGHVSFAIDNKNYLVPIINNKIKLRTECSAGATARRLRVKLIAWHK